MSDEPKSLADHWDGWPESAKLYRASKQDQVSKLQAENERLRQVVRSRDAVIRELAAAIVSALAWWNTGVADGYTRVVAGMQYALERARVEQAT
jgi:hypothetical protein